MANLRQHLSDTRAGCAGYGGDAQKPEEKPVFRGALTAFLLGLLSFILTVVGSRANVGPNGDEIYHLLAAASWLTSGEYTVAGGTYERASLYTQFVAMSFSLLGVSLSTAMLTSGIALGALVASMVLCLRSMTGLGTAILAALLLALSPHALEFGATVRFYTLQTASFWLGAWSIYLAFAEARRPLLFSALGVVCLGIALHLQVASAIGIASIVLWIGLLLLYRLWINGVDKRVLACLVAAVLVALISAFAIGIFDDIWARYRAASPWNENSRFRYYYWVMTEHYNPFWAILPICAVLALATRPAVSFFSLLVFCVSFVFHSFGGMKEDRYILYVLPFFFTVIAIGLVQALSIVRLHLHAILADSLGLLKTEGRIATAALSVGAGSFLIVANLGYVSSIKDLARGTVKREQPDWPSLVDAYAPQLALAPVIMTNTPLHVAYHLGLPSIGIGRSQLVDGRGTGEFSTDFRTGMSVISEASSIELMLRCVPHGYLVVEERQWLNNPSTGINSRMIPVIQSHMDLIATPSAWGIRLYEWVEPYGVDADGALGEQGCDVVFRGLDSSRSWWMHQLDTDPTESAQGSSA